MLRFGRGSGKWCESLHRLAVSTGASAQDAYAFPAVHSVVHIVPPLYVSASSLRTTHLRDPNGPAGTFAGESFMDEIAAQAGVDPVEFRLRYVEDRRARAVLTAAERAKWDHRPSPKLGRLFLYSSQARGGTSI
jgi:CO/xanthine dehydrogenase Mo-binding subunit